MAHFNAISLVTVAVLLLLSTTLAQSSDFIPPCLAQCIQQTTQPCTTSSLPLLINCVNANCHPSLDGSIDSDTASFASGMALTYTPKVQYSCQQSVLPGSSEDAPSMQLTGDGKCMTSPYDFQSMFVSASSTSDDDDDGITLQKMARQCSMTLYSGEGCKGDETKLDLGDVQGDKCIFQGGRSAKLVCDAFRALDTPSFASVVTSLCGASIPNATAPVPAGTNTTTPYAGSENGTITNATSPSEPPLPSLTSQPYTGRASAEQVAKPSLIALVALFAVAILLL